MPYPLEASSRINSLPDEVTFQVLADKIKDLYAGVTAANLNKPYPFNWATDDVTIGKLAAHLKFLAGSIPNPIIKPSANHRVNSTVDVMGLPAVIATLNDLGAGATGAAVREFGLINRADGGWTYDGSVGQTYNAPVGMTGIQWYREALAVPLTQTLISGATSATYIAQSSDEGYRLVAKGTLAGVLTDAVAYQVVFPKPYLIEAATSPTGWVVANGGVLDVNGGKLRLMGTGTASAQITKSDVGSWDPSTMGTIAYGVDSGMDEGRPISTHQVILRRSGVEQYLAGVTDMSTMYETPSQFLMGKLWGGYHVSEVAGLNTPGGSNMGLVIKQASALPHAAVGTYEPVLAKAGGRATIILGFDDNEATQGANAFPAMQERGLKGIFYVPVSLTSGQAGRNTIAKLLEMYADGWDCGLDSTHNDDISSSFGTMAAWEASFLQNRAFAIAQGMTRGNEHIVYTHGQIEKFPNPGPLPSNRVTSTSVTSDGTDVVILGGTVTGYPTGQAVTVGMRMAGYNAIDPAIVVTEVINSTTIRVSQNIPAQVKPMWFLDTSDDFYTFKLPKRVKELGIRTARTTRNQGSYLTRFGLGDRGMFTFGNALHGVTLDAFKARIDQAILRGTTIEWYTHQVVTGAPGGSIELSLFLQMMDYLVLKRDQGLLDVMTWSQVWARDGNAGVPTNLSAPPQVLPATNISFISSSTGVTTPATLAGQQAGDLLIAFAYKDGGAPVPTLPAGWTLVGSDTINNSGYLLAQRIATAADEVIPAFTGATNTLVHCYRGASGVGNVSPMATGASGFVVTSTGWALQQSNNTSWIAYFGGVRSAGSNLETNANRSGHTNATSTSDAGGSDTMGPVSAVSAFTIGTSGGSTWSAVAVEIKA